MGEAEDRLGNEEEEGKEEERQSRAGGRALGQELQGRRWPSPQWRDWVAAAPKVWGGEGGRQRTGGGNPAGLLPQTQRFSDSLLPSFTPEIESVTSHVPDTAGHWGSRLTCSLPS